MLTIFNIKFEKATKNFITFLRFLGALLLQLLHLPYIICCSNTLKSLKMKTDVLLWRFVSRGLIDKYNKIRQASPLLSDSPQFSPIFCDSFSLSFSVPVAVHIGNCRKSSQAKKLCRSCVAV